MSDTIIFDMDGTLVDSNYLAVSHRSLGARIQILIEATSVVTW